MRQWALVVCLTVMCAVPAVAQTVVRSRVDVVHFAVAVLDKTSDAVPNLTAADFELIEDGRAQEIRYLAMGEDGEPPPLHVGLLFDTSGSMSDDIKIARGAAIRFLNRLQHAEDMTLVDFDTEVRVARYGQADFPRLVERLRGRKPDGWTALYDALGVYLDGALDQQGQKVLIVYTDGGDTTSEMTFRDCLEGLKASDVSVYAIGFLEHQSSSVKMQQKLYLQQIAEATGGRAFFPMSIKEIDKAYDQIEQELQTRYLLGYVSSNTSTDGKWRDVEIKLKRPDLKDARLRTRKGYYALFRDQSTGGSK